MKKSILKKLVLISCFSAVLFTSCEKEPLEAEHANYESNIKKTKVNFDDLKKNEKAFNVFKSLNLTDTKPNIKNSNVQNATSYNFEIDFNDGTHFSYHNLESYTFPIRRVIDNGLLENIVISEHTDGRYYAKLLKYNLTLQEKIDLANDELKSIQNPIVTEVLGEYSFGNQIQSDCGWVTITTITACANGHTSTSQCNLTGSAAPRIKTITVAIPCNDDSGGGGTGDGSGGYYGDPFNGNGGGGGYITPSFPNDSTPTEYYENGISEPVLSTETNADFRNVNLFYQSLTPQQQQWIGADFNNLMIYNQLIQYQRDNAWSDDSNNFAKELIDSSRLLEINSMEVWNDYDKFVSQMSISEKAIFENQLANRKLWYMVSAKKAFDKANEFYPNSTHNGKGDAFRHALWNGLCALTLAGNLGEQLTTAHENKPSQYTYNYKETEMDLYNNQKGRQIALISNLRNLTDNVLEDLNNGYLRYLNNLTQSVDPQFNNLDTYNSILIPTNQ